MSGTEDFDAGTRFGLDQAIAHHQAANESTIQPTEPISWTDCSLKIHEFNDKFMDELPINCTIIFMRKSIFLWLGVGDLAAAKPDLLNLALSISRASDSQDGDDTATSVLLRQSNEDESFTSSLSARLAKAFKTRVFASCHFSESPSAVNGGSNGLTDASSEVVQAWIEKRIVKELKQCQTDGMFI